jgi:hypothetical protein
MGRDVDVAGGRAPDGMAEDSGGTGEDGKGAEAGVGRDGRAPAFKPTGTCMTTSDS